MLKIKNILIYLFSNYQGDSGGPLTVNGVLVGLASWVYSGCPADSSNYPAVYADPSAEIAWINSNTV